MVGRSRVGAGGDDRERAVVVALGDGHLGDLGDLGDLGGEGTLRPSGEAHGGQPGADPVGCCTGESEGIRFRHRLGGPQCGRHRRCRHEAGTSKKPLETQQEGRPGVIADREGAASGQVRDNLQWILTLGPRPHDERAITKPRRLEPGDDQRGVVRRHDQHGETLRSHRLRISAHRACPRQSALPRSL